jgi:hypothetical protein
MTKAQSIVVQLKHVLTKKAIVTVSESCIDYAVYIYPEESFITLWITACTIHPLA